MLKFIMLLSVVLSLTACSDPIGDDLGPDDPEITQKHWLETGSDE